MGTPTKKKPGEKTKPSSGKKSKPSSGETDSSTDSSESKTAADWVVDNKWLVIIVGGVTFIVGLAAIIACACCCGGQPQPQQQFMMPGPAMYGPGPQMC